MKKLVLSFNQEEKVKKVNQNLLTIGHNVTFHHLVVSHHITFHHLVMFHRISLHDISSSFSKVLGTLLTCWNICFSWDTFIRRHLLKLTAEFEKTAYTSILHWSWINNNISINMSHEAYILCWLSWYISTCQQRPYLFQHVNNVPIYDISSSFS